jgi:high-affinity iron transporter
MTFSFLVTAREGIEMALIVTILLGYLRSVDQKQHFRAIWLGVAAATALAVGVGAGLEVASRELDGRVLEAFEGFTMLFAVGVLTWMLFWMRSNSAGISKELRAQMDVALSAGSVTALTLIAFSTVSREGLETALFLFAGSSAQGMDLNFLIGGLLGFVVAGVTGVIIYYGFARLPLRHFFTISAVALMILAAGMLTNSLTELHEATVISDLGQRPWDTEELLPMSSDLGKFSHPVLGYDSAPAISQIVLYWLAMMLAVTAYFALPLIMKPRQRTPAPVSLENVDAAQPGS